MKTTVETSYGIAGDDGILLSLPQTDLGRYCPSNKRLQVTSNNTIIPNQNTDVKKADLVLFQLPKSESFQKELFNGNCQFVASHQSASLVSPSTSYKLVTVGTSNTLVVWSKNNDQSSSTTDREEINIDTVSSSSSSSCTFPSSKRMKVTIPVAQCRLIQPGGSGASFLIGQPHVVNPLEILQWFEQRNLSSSSVSSLERMVSTSKLANLFQASPVQIETAMSQIANIVEITKNNNNNHQILFVPENDSQQSQEQYWQLVTDEVLYGQRALTEFLCEEEDVFDYFDHSDNNNNHPLQWQKVCQGVTERLMPVLFDQDMERSMAIARKTVCLAQKDPSKRSYDASSSSSKVRLDPHKVAFYVLRGLFLQCPTYSVTDLFEKWAARLPLGETFEQCVSMEWLQEYGFFSKQQQQLVLENNVVQDDHDHKHHNNNNVASSSRSSQVVIRLATRSTVLSLNQS